jgi:hypothetical protein
LPEEWERPLLSHTIDESVRVEDEHDCMMRVVVFAVVLVVDIVVSDSVVPVAVTEKMEGDLQEQGSKKATSTGEVAVAL